MLIASCSKDSWFNPGSDHSMAFSKGYPAHGPVIVVPPNKDGDDDGDTDDLLEALAEAEGTPGTTIQLTEGNYYVSYMQILGFDGRITGAGRNNTIINVAGKINQNQQINDFNLMPCWLRIIGGNVFMSDFAFKTGNGSLVAEPDSWYNETLISLVVVNNYSDDYGKDDHQPMNFTLRNVDFLCGSMDEDKTYSSKGYNVLMPLWFGFPYWWPPADGYVLAKGNYNVENCYFDNSYQGFEAFGLGEEAVCNVIRTKTNDVLLGIFCSANFGATINFTDNTFVNSEWFDILIDDSDWGILGLGDFTYNKSKYLVSGNKFYSSTGVSSLVFQDTRQLQFPDFYHNPTLAIIKNNYFSLNEGCTGITLFSNTDGQIRNNRFTGKADIGIRVDGLTWGYLESPPQIYNGGISKNALILGNNLRGLDADEAHILLGEKSEGCAVVGNAGETIIDEGTDNKIVGMKMLPGGHHAGQYIRDNFRMWHPARHR